MGDQFVMGAAFDDFPLVEYEDAVGVADGAEAVGDHEAGAAGHEALEGFVDEALAFGVEGGSGLVEK